MNEDELRALFARHEDLAPPPEPVMARITEGYRRRRRRRVGFRGAGIAVATAVAIATPAVAINAVGARPRPVPAASSSPTPTPMHTGPLNFLLAGTDGQSGELSRADTIIIVHIAATRDHVSLVSISRDTLVTIPASGTYRGGREKLNAAYAFGGVALLRRTIEANFGVTVDGTLDANFAGFEQVIRLLGGVYMCVDEKTVSVHVGTGRNGGFAAPYRFDAQGVPHPVPGVTPHVYELGCRHFAPWEALDYARQRYFLPGGEIDRERHTRQLLTALFKEIRAGGVLTDPHRVEPFLQAVQAAVRVDAGGLPVLELASTLGGLGGKQLVGVQAPADPRPLLTALSQDRLDGWLAAHPDAVTGQ